MSATPRRLLVVWHIFTGATAAMVEALLEGARTSVGEAVQVIALRAADASADDVLAAFTKEKMDALREQFGHNPHALKYVETRIGGLALAGTQQMRSYSRRQGEAYKTSVFDAELTMAQTVFSIRPRRRSAPVRWSCKAMRCRYPSQCAMPGVTIRKTPT